MSILRVVSTSFDMNHYTGLDFENILTNDTSWGTMFAFYERWLTTQELKLATCYLDFAVRSALKGWQHFHSCPSNS